MVTDINGLKRDETVAYLSLAHNMKGYKMTNWIVKRDYTDDGVVGLNGDQYLLDDNNKIMEFQNKQEAITFLTDNGIDLTADEGITICQQ